MILFKLITVCFQHQPQRQKRLLICRLCFKSEFFFKAQQEANGIQTKTFFFREVQYFHLDGGLVLFQKRRRLVETQCCVFCGIKK